MSGGARLGLGIAIAVSVLAVGAFAVAQLVLFNSDSDSYTVTISIDAMDVACDDGYVYNVCVSTTSGDRYYDPSTGSFDLSTPSKYAVLYAEFSIGTVTNYSDYTGLKKVQTSDVPVSSGDPSVNDVTFKVGGDGSSIRMTVFLKLKGSDSNLDYGTVVDIYEGTPEVSGIIVDVDLKKGTKSYEMCGNDEAVLRGLLKFDVTVSPAQ